MRSVQINYYTTLICEDKDLSDLLLALMRCQVAHTSYMNGKDLIDTTDPVELNIKTARYIEEIKDESPTS